MIGSIALLPHALNVQNTFAEDSMICDVYDDLSVKKSLEQNDPVVKIFLEAFPDAEYFAGGVDESDPPKISINYENKDSTKNTHLNIYVREVGPSGESCFWPITYMFQYITVDVHKNIVHDYSDKESMVDFIENFATSSPHQQLKQGVEYYDIECKYDLVLVVKSNKNNSSCVKFDTANKLIERGWGVCSDLVFYGRGNPCGPHSSGVVAFDTYKEISIVHILSHSVTSENKNNLIPDVITTVLGKNNTVTWINERESPITLVSDTADNAWSTGLILPGKDASITFNHTGIFGYHGNPGPWITGKVIVLER